MCLSQGAIDQIFPIGKINFRTNHNIYIFGLDPLM